MLLLLVPPASSIASRNYSRMRQPTRTHSPQEETTMILDSRYYYYCCYCYYYYSYALHFGSNQVLSPQMESGTSSRLRYLLVIECTWKTRRKSMLNARDPNRKYAHSNSNYCYYCHYCCITISVDTTRYPHILLPCSSVSAFHAVHLARC